LNNKTELDRIISKLLINWKLSRIAQIDKTLLRIGAAEILFAGKFINKTWSASTRARTEGCFIEPARVPRAFNLPLSCFIPSKAAGIIKDRVMYFIMHATKFLFMRLLSGFNSWNIIFVEHMLACFRFFKQVLVRRNFVGWC